MVSGLLWIPPSARFFLHEDKMLTHLYLIQGHRQREQQLSARHPEEGHRPRHLPRFVPRRVRDLCHHRQHVLRRPRRRWQGLLLGRLRRPHRRLLQGAAGSRLVGPGLRRGQLRWCLHSRWQLCRLDQHQQVDLVNSGLGASFDVGCTLMASLKWKGGPGIDSWEGKGK